jgi:hypothetical protein
MGITQEGEPASDPRAKSGKDAKYAESFNCKDQGLREEAGRSQKEGRRRWMGALSPAQRMLEITEF